jgi:mannose-6-phosphate isomerase-like protein (cupin superfamily)
VGSPQCYANRDFDGQRFVFHRAAERAWTPGPQAGFEMRDTGINRATGGFADAIVIRPCGPAPDRPATHQHDFYFSFVLNGSLELKAGKSPSSRLSRGDCFLVPPGVPCAQTGFSPDLEILRVTLPGRAR